MDNDTELRHLSDEELAAQAAAGSRRSFDELVSRYASRLFNFLKPKSGSDEDTEDLIQEAFLRAFRNIGRYNPKWKFSTWLYTIAIRLAISRHRSPQLKLFRLEAEEVDGVSSGPQEILIQREDIEERKNIWYLARTLRPQEYEVLWLHYAEGLPVEEIARAMKRSKVGVRVLLHRARLKLADRLRPSAHQERLAAASPAERRLSVF